MTQQRRLIINADDLGMHPAIDMAVLRLAESGIVSSTSLMVLMKPDADVLRTLARGGIDLGLHLDFTSEAAAERYGFTPGVRALLTQCYAGHFPRQLARNIVDEQLQRFGEVTGSMPVFIDGHEHAHQFPAIREALLQAIAALPPHARPYVRNTRPLQWRGLKAAIIGQLGAGKLTRRARKLGCLGNLDFLGVYALEKEVRLEQLWEHWLKTAPVQGALAMCHPATAAFAPGNAFRLREYDFLSSAAFAEMHYQYNTSIVGWRTALGIHDSGDTAFCPG